MEKLAYTCRQVNTLPKKPLPLFNLVVICDINQLDEAAVGLKKCFDEVEQAYWYNKSVHTGAYILVSCCWESYVTGMARASSKGLNLDT